MFLEYFKASTESENSELENSCENQQQKRLLA